MKKIMISFLLFLSLLAFIQPVKANRQGSAQDLQMQDLQIAVKALLHYFEQNNSFINNGRFVWQGDIVVEPGAEYYAVTLPELIIQLESQRSINVGLLAINAISVQKDGRNMWSFSLALPTPMFIYQAGEIIGQFKVDHQEVAILWDTVYQFPVQLSVSAGNLRYDNYRNGNVSLVQKIDIEGLYKADEKGFLSGGEQYSLDHIEMNDKHKNKLLEIGSLKIKNDVLNMDWKNLQLLKDSNKDFLNWVSQNPQELNITSFISLLESWIGFVEKETLTIQANTVSFLDHVTKESINIPKFNAQFLSNKDFKVLLEAPVIQSKEKEDGRVKLDLIVQNLPQEDKTKAWLESLKRDNKQNKSSVASYDIFQLFKEAGTSIVINEAIIKTPQSELFLKGKATVDNLSSFGVVANFDIFLESLGMMMEEIEKYEKIYNPKEQSLFSIMKLLSPIIEGFGNNKEVAGKTLYRLEVTPDGKIMVNGLSLHEVITGFGVQFPIQQDQLPSQSQ